MDEIRVLYRAERDLAGWQHRHDAGDVPGRWPYGLDALAWHGLSVTAESVAAPGPVHRAAARAIPARLRVIGPRARTTGVAWDENVAQRMVERRPFRRMFTGVIWLTDRLPAAAPQQHRAMRALLSSMDGLWVISRAQVEPLREFLGPSGPPVEFVRFGVDAAFFAPRPYPERPLVVSVGGDRDRDTELLFAAMAEVRRARPEAQIVVQSTSSATPPPGVVVIPRLTHRELRELYAQAGVVAIAARPNLHFSGMTVSLEAMATGRPVVITESPGMDDYLRPDHDAVVVRRRADALATGVIRLLDDPGAAEQMGRNGRSTVEERLTTEHLATQLAAFLRAHCA